jgi:NitT/TauT family transport system permease protein
VIRTLGRLAFPLSLLGFLLAWEGVLRLVPVPSYILPLPSAILVALADGLSQPMASKAGYYYHLGFTLWGAIGGYLIGCATGIVLGTLMAEFPAAERILLPYAVGLQSLPKVALAPLILIWFGFDIGSKVALAALLTFFPLLMHTFVGLTMVDRDLLTLLRSFRASRWRTFRLVKFPTALPLVFAGLDMATVYALLGAIVGEFVGARAGMGVMILQNQYVNNTAGVFAVLIILAAVGIALHTVARAAGHRVVFWTRTEERTAVTA